MSTKDGSPGVRMRVGRFREFEERRKRNYNEITEKTGVSAATISRINRCLHYGTGGYKTALLRLEDDEKKNGTK